MKTIAIRAVLWIVIVGLIYWLGKIVYDDIHFQDEKVRIETARVRKLEKIRELQFAYKDVNRGFADKWEKLLDFGKNGDFILVKTIGDPNDTTIVVQRDTTKVPVLDSLFNGNSAIVDSLPMIPFSEKNAKFKINAGRINLRNVYVDVFEVTDTDPFDKEDDPLQVGSMYQATFDVNREYK